MEIREKKSERAYRVRELIEFDPLDKTLDTLPLELSNL